MNNRSSKSFTRLETKNIGEYFINLCDIINESLKNKIESYPMTVCIAAIAENGKKMVLATDNMITTGIGTSIQYQKENKDHKKIVQLNDHVYVLVAGALHVMNPVIVMTKEEIKPNTSPVKAANIVRENLQKFYLQKTEEEILRRININWDFFKNHQKEMDSEIIKDLYTKINNFNLDINIIIAGYDEQNHNPYLGMAIGNGYLFDNTLNGFVTNGSGGDLAKFSLTLSDYAQSLSVDKVQNLVEKAIIDAKKTPGVGDLGDLIIIPKKELEKSEKNDI
jgi:20S proteasome alpha/beta subunit